MVNAKEVSGSDGTSLGSRFVHLESGYGGSMIHVSGAGGRKSRSSGSMVVKFRSGSTEPGVDVLGHGETVRRNDVAENIVLCHGDVCFLLLMLNSTKCKDIFSLLFWVDASEAHL